MKQLLVVTICLLAAGCASSPKQVEIEQHEDVILSRIDNAKERPAWLKESEPFRVQGDEVIALGSTTIAGDDRVDAAYRIAENNAKASISQGVESKLEYIFQNAEEGTSIAADQTRFIGSEVSSLTTSAIRPKYRYWEKYSSVNESGQKIMRYRVFAAVSMPEADFKRAVLNAVRKREGKAGISKEFAIKVDKQWDTLVAPSEK